MGPNYDQFSIVILKLNCYYFLFSVVTGSTDGIGKSYAEEVGNFQDFSFWYKNIRTDIEWSLTVVLIFEVKSTNIVLHYIIDVLCFDLVRNAMFA